MSKRLAEFIDNLYYIVDSEIVKSMIQKEPYRFNTFVAIRIGEIQESTISNQRLWT